jgi:hypothetical protein
MKTNPVRSYHSIKEELEKLEKEGKSGDFFETILPRAKEKADKAKNFIKKYDLQNNNEIRDAAIRFVINNPNTHSVCISFNNFDDVTSYEKLSGGRLTSTDQAKLNAYREGMWSALLPACMRDM